MLLLLLLLLLVWTLLDIVGQTLTAFDICGHCGHYLTDERDLYETLFLDHRKHRLGRRL